MELAAEERAEAGLGYDTFRPRGGVRRLRGVRVREVERAALVDVGPAHARDASFQQARRAARDETEPGDAVVLVRPVERELQAETDPEDRPVLLEPLAQHDVVRALAEARHRGARRADARQHCEISCADVGGDLGAEPAERDLHGAHVAGAVAADRDVHRIPFVDGMPAPAGATAIARARPTALNAASAT